MPGVESRIFFSPSSAVTPGEVYRIAPGHDAWVVCGEPAVFVNSQGVAHYTEG